MISDLAPRANESLRIARIVLEAAIALGDKETRAVATAECSLHISTALERVDQLRVRNEIASALELLRETHELTPPDSPERVATLWSLAEHAKVAEEWERAHELVAECLARIPEDPDWDDWRVDLFILRAEAYVLSGVPDLAVEPLRAAGRVVEGGSVKPTTYLEVARLQADVWLATDRLERLVLEVEKILFERESGAEAKSPEGQLRAELRLRLGLAKLELGALQPERRTEATDDLEAAWRDLEDSIERFHCETHLAFAGLLEDDEVETAKWLQRARARAEQTEHTDYDVGFLAALEARLELKRGGDAVLLGQHADELGARLERMLERASSAPPRPGGLAFLRYSRRRFVVGTLMELAMKLDPAGGKEEALRTLHRVRREGTLVRRLAQGASDFERARAPVTGANGGALIFFVGRDRSHVFALEPAQITHAPLDGEWSLRAAVQELDRHLLQNPHKLDEKRRKARRRALDTARANLSTALFPEAIRERVREWETVTIIGTDLLGEPDFECLSIGDGDLGLSKPLTYLTSLAEGLSLATRAHPTRDPEEHALTLVADVPLAEHRLLQPLPLSREGAVSLAGPFGERTRYLLGERATHSRISEAGARGELLVFLTHGDRDPLSERASRILIAATGDDDTLSCDEVEALRVPRTVFLGVCGSGRGPAREGAGPVSHLGGALLFAGANAVVLSDSDLSYTPTRLMTQSFLRAMGAGASPAEAMRRARATLVEADWSDPHDYALMRVIGLGHARAPVAPAQGR